MRSRFDWKRVRSRVVLIIVAISLLILAGVSLYTYRTYQDAAQELAIETDRQTAYVGAARLRDEMNRFSRELESLARSRQVYGGQAVEQQLALSAARHRLTIFDGGVVFLDNFGRVRTSEPARPDIQGADWSNRDYFRRLLGSAPEFYSDVTNDGPDGSLVAVVSVPVTGEHGEFMGVLAGMFQLGESRISSLYASIIRLRMSDAGDTYILDRSGRIIYDSSYTRAGQTLAIPAGNEDDIQGFAVRTTNADGEDVITAFAPIPGTGWTLARENAWATASNATQKYANTLVVLLALGTVLPALGIALLIRTQNADMIEREHRGQEQRVAWLIQERLLPQTVPMLPDWNIAVCYKPLPISGGDFYDFLLLPDGMLAITLGHANARGLDAAHVIDTVRATLRGAAQLRLPPGEALTYSNKLVCPELQHEACVVALYALLDPMTGQLTFATAGAKPPWLSTDSPHQELVPLGLSLGLDVDSSYEQHSLTISPGTYSLLASSGLFQARRPDGNLFSLETLHAIIQEPDRDANAIAETLSDMLKSYTGARGLPPDDVTVIVLERHASPAPPTADGQAGAGVRQIHHSVVLQPE